MNQKIKFDVLSVKIGLTDSSVGEFNWTKKVYKFRTESFYLNGEQKPLGGLSPIFWW